MGTYCYAGGGCGSGKEVRRCLPSLGLPIRDDRAATLPLVTAMNWASVTVLLLVRGPAAAATSRPPGGRKYEGDDLIMVRNAVIDRTEDPRAPKRRQGPPAERSHGGGGAVGEGHSQSGSPRFAGAAAGGDLTGDRQTDVIDRALQVYAYMEEVNANGGDVYVRELKDSDLKVVKMSDFSTVSEPRRRPWTLEVLGSAFSERTSRKRYVAG